MKSQKVADEIFLLRLYVAGNSPNSLKAEANLKAICEQYLSGRYKIEIIDTLVDQPNPFEEGVLVTPTLIKKSPLPRCQIIGNLSDTPKVLLALGGLGT